MGYEKKRCLQIAYLYTFRWSYDRLAEGSAEGGRCRPASRFA